MAIAIPLPASRRRRITRRLPAMLALGPCGDRGDRGLSRLHAVDGRLSFTSSKMLPTLDFVGFDQYARLFSNARFLVSIENLVVFGALFLSGCLVFGFLLAAFIDQRVRAEGALRTIYLYPHAMSFIVTGLVWQWFLNPTLGLQKLMHDAGWQNFTFDWLVNKEMVVYTLVIAGVWQSAGLIMAILLAGLRGVDEDLWKAARIDGIPTWRVYFSIVLPILRPMLITSTVLLAIAVVKVYDLVVAMTRGGPGTASEMPAKFVMDHLFERANVGLATACATVHAGHRDRGAGALALLAVRGAGQAESGMTVAEPSGRRPRHLTWGRIGVYAFLLFSAAFFLLPLWIMLLTSVKTMDEIRLGNILALPADPTLQPWIAAWSEACTGLACEGIQVGFWNSVRILIPSVILSILVGALNGYALCFWRVRGADLLFAILLVGAFIPYQVFLYPLVRLFSTVGIYNSLPGIVVVHVIFGMPIMTLAVPQLLLVFAARAVQRRAHRRRRFHDDLLAGDAADVDADADRRDHPAGDRHLE